MPNTIKWRAVHDLGANCTIPYETALARSGMSARELAEQTEVRLRGGWKLVRVMEGVST